METFLVSIFSTQSILPTRSRLLATVKGAIQHFLGTPRLSLWSESDEKMHISFISVCPVQRQVQDLFSLA